MARTAYVNGRFAPIGAATVPVEDRGYQFADGVYEVLLVVDGMLWDAQGHFARWRRSLSELAIPLPMSEASMRLVVRKLLRRNRLRNALVYMQATRGVAPRNHAFPVRPPAPSIVMTARPFDLPSANRKAEKGVRVILAEDIRWGRVDIKTVSLLPNVLAKDAARRAGAIEAWLHRGRVVTEGASSNAWIVDPDGALVTHPKTNEILGGITRESVMACAEELQMKVIERPFTLEEASAAREAFITSATNLVTPVVTIGDRAVGGGAPGDVALRLRRAYIDRSARLAAAV
ncbi:MAG: D-amino-acid transaminase [Alphaproteobacteria bacterium]|nr:D-amino-acid transaminase [Alphaproteobacteria bacterium]